MTDNDVLHCITIRSEKAHARIIRILVPDLPEGVVFIRAADIPGENLVDVRGEGMPILAEGMVRYIGEPVALIAGPEIRELEALRDAIQITYEELDPLFTFELPAAEQVYARKTKQQGDPDEALGNAFQVIEGEYRTGAQEHMYSEPQGAYARWESPDVLSIYTASQWPYHVRKTVCDAIGSAPGSVHVKASESGMALDGKLWYPSIVAAHAALVARATRRPVKLLYTREEDFLFTSKRTPAYFKHVSGLDRDGHLTAMKVQIFFNAGAYPVFTQEILDRMIISSTGAYNCDNIRVEGICVTTNLPPMNVFGGFGAAQSFFAVETHTFRVTEVAQMDPCTWKRENVLRKGQVTFTGVPMKQDANAADILETLERESDFQRKYAAYELQKKRRTDLEVQSEFTRGIGIAFAYQGTGFHGLGEDDEQCTVSVSLDTDGRAEIRTSAIPGSATLEQIWKQNVVDILGIPEGEVVLAEVNTAVTPDAGPSTLSRNITVVNRLIENCCNAIKKLRFRHPLPIEVKRTFRLPRGREWNPEMLIGEPFASTSWGGAVVEVEVNPVTFEAHVRGIWILIDGGRILRIDQAQKSVETAVFQALGWASQERVEYEHGRLTWRDFQAFQTSAFAEYPKIWIQFADPVEKDGARGIGELPANLIPAAYIEAVSQATGRYMDRIPTTPETINAYLEAP
jgi:CO/xanthine dehydrogenase Mo-binding subunit